ncbi:related to acid phosphatase [Cephalotrichum gorgonifer]|uniref:Related to acid phosphatase n=1 Tax=Cephalotrichum gorgonifer TaxID=2041049 RepID=A0AAE8SS53_9PEZI|nr:related to acid phosphatase [Cephalotrichum gorgonifer]
MAELKTEPAPSSLWHNYGSPVHMPTSRFHPTMEPGLPNPPTPTSQHAARPRNSQHSMEQPHYPYNRFPQEEPEPYERHQHQSLPQHQSFPSLKRTYSQTEQPPYQDMVQDIREDNSKLNVNHDHKLLSFKRSQDKSTIVDQHGRIQQLELSSQLHGMFFLSEMPSNATDGSILQPELTCYRRNLFQISGSLITPRGQLSVVAESGETVAVSNMEVTISAIESVDGNPVRLIVIPWKTPPPNSPEISHGPDQEPQSLPLIPFQDDGAETEGEYAVYPIGWRRLQFRIATANNGRRKELQQHFVLHLKVMATLANGSKTVLTESTTAPIVVRGRSPRNFQARKEIPLLGSSAGSRGQALVETGLGIVAGPLTVKPGDKPRGADMQPPRTAFTFSAPKVPGGQIGMRSNSYPSWNPPNHVSMPPIPVSSPNAYSSTTMSSESYHKGPMSGNPNFTAEPQDMPLQTSMPSVQLSMAASEPQPPIRTQYAYAPSPTAPPPMPGQTDNSLSVPRYVDSNPRPSKSPRHANNESVHSAGSITNSETAGEYRYGNAYHEAPLGSSNNTSSEIPSPYAPEAHPPPPRDYYPPSNTWTSTAGGPHPTSAYANGEARTYTFPEPYKGASAPTSATGPAPPALPKVHTGAAATTAPVYNNGVSHYSWSAS